MWGIGEEKGGRSGRGHRDRQRADVGPGGVGPETGTPRRDMFLRDGHLETTYTKEEESPREE